jgi:hypothetical protein
MATHPRSASDDTADIPDLTGQVALVEHHPPAHGAGHLVGDSHRALFESKLHQLTADIRESMAIQVGEPELSALCFDPVSRVIRRLVDNPRFALAHARLVAAHHGNASGLDAIGARGVFIGDAEVQRMLLRNPQTPLHLLRRILGRRRALEIWNVCQSHDVTDRNKSTARECLRTRFATCSSEEKVELVLKSEGRALTALSGLPLDAKSVGLLCKQTYASTILVRNIAQWGPAPPPLLAHLLKQTLVRQNSQLRTLIKRHPNCPSSME